MAINIPKRNYLTFVELKQRWSCTEDDLCYQVLSGELKPCIKSDEEMQEPEWKTHWLKGLIPVEPPEREDRGFYFNQPDGWYFLQFPIQTSAFDCKFSVISNIRDPIKISTRPQIEDSEWFWLTRSITMNDVLEIGVFMLTEVARFESVHGEVDRKREENSLKTIERQSLLKMVIGMAIDGYGFVPNASKSDIPKQLADSLAELGLEITDDTIRKYLKLATETVLPSKPK